MTTHKKKHHGHGKHHPHKEAAHDARQERGGPSAQHERPAPKNRSSDTLKNAAIAVLSLALVAVIIWTLTDRPDNSSEKTDLVTGKTDTGIQVAAGNFDIDPAIAQAMKTLADDDPFIGAEEAPVTMVEFSDYQCGFCGRFHDQTLPLIKENFVDTGLVKFVYRDLALYAAEAAEAAQCAHDQGAFWEYHDLIFAESGSLGKDTFLKFAADLGLDVASFEECFDSGKYANEVVEDSADARNQGFSATPSFVINGKQVVGALPYEEFERTICSFIPQSEPCQNVKPPMTVTVVTDASCPDCDTSGIKSTTTNYFPGTTYKDVDVSSTEGKELVAAYDLSFLPAYLFPEDVAQTSGWSDLSDFFEKTQDGYRLKDTAVGAQWPLGEDEQEAYLQAYEEMLAKLETYGVDNLKVLGATGEKPRLDYFVMSFCPYGNPADEAAAKIYGLLGDAVEIVPHYIIDLRDGEMSSLHGEGEGNQGVRELCALEEYGYDVFFDFVLKTNEQCNSGNVESCWEGAAADAGLTDDQVAGIASCFDDRWQDITADESATNAALKTINSRDPSKLTTPTASPTFLIDGETYRGSRDAESIKQALCAGFSAADRPDACGTALTGETAQVTGSC
ncbi:DsbA family protein [Candidatus Woesearchaeota archaeon]|nr:DsbA family protein [Candidatus Woesearchaeota archaeon]